MAGNDRDAAERGRSSEKPAETQDPKTTNPKPQNPKTSKLLPGFQKVVVGGSGGGLLLVV